MRGLVLVVLLVVLATPCLAQDTPPEPVAAPDTSIDVTKLGVSLSRIQKALTTAESRPKTSGEALRLDINIQVFGTAPRIEVLKGFDLMNGQVPGTAPSHRQFIEYVTPQLYRLPALPLSSFAAWAAQWAWQQNKKSRCEEEIRNYRELVMQGVNVSAPRCTQ